MSFKCIPLGDRIEYRAQFQNMGQTDTIAYKEALKQISNLRPHYIDG